VLSVDAAVWDVDLFRLRRALRADTPAAERAGALQAVTGNLAHAQFPFDDQLIDERRVVANAIRRLRADLSSADVIDPTRRPDSTRPGLGRLTDSDHEMIA
jgi:hypothetical protein